MYLGLVLSDGRKDSYLQFGGTDFKLFINKSQFSVTFFKGKFKSFDFNFNY